MAKLIDNEEESVLLNLADGAGVQSATVDLGGNDQEHSLDAFIERQVATQALFEETHKDEIKNERSNIAFSNPDIALDAMCQVSRQTLTAICLAANKGSQEDIGRLLTSTIQEYIWNAAIDTVQKEVDSQQMHEQQYCKPCNTTVENCNCGDS